MTDMVGLRLLTNCNNNCIFCSNDKKEHYMISFEEAIKHLRTARAKGIKKLNLRGGEPTLYPKIIELVNVAKEMGFNETYIITNGRMFSYKRFTINIFQAGLHGINLSMHGSKKEILDKITRTGSFEQAYEGLKKISRYRKRFGIFLYIRFIITRYNIDDIQNFIDMLYRIEPETCLELCFPLPHGNAKINEQEIFFDQEKLVKSIASLKTNPNQKVITRNIPYCMIKNKNISPSKNQSDTFENEKGNMKFFARNKLYIRGNSCENCPHVSCPGVHKDLIGILNVR